MRIRQTAGEIVFNIFNTIFLGIVVYITLAPFWSIFISSISDPQLVIRNEVGWYPKGLTLLNYRVIFSNDEVFVAYWNTIVYTTLGTVINILFTFTMAYPLSRRTFYGRGIYMKLVTFTMLFSGGLIPTFLVVNGLGMYNTIWAIVIPGAITTWNLIITITFFMALPSSLEESAMIDGANDIQVFVRIYIPLSMPIFATMTLFYAVGHWNDFFGPLIYLNDKKYYPLTIFLRSIISAAEVKQYEMSGAMDTGSLISVGIKYATIIATTLPIICVYPFLQKYFVKGVMIGSIKG
ncbi:MAG: carbohydrate ABC transporter permease [Clostridiaceae bacterium]|nr:carbohydrate ABC transporter permease [Clostridiaceae bacterium]